MLLAKSGEVVTREELKTELWPNEEYGEFDLGLNTAVKKVRQALGDSGESPRWIETVPRVGYKFLATPDQTLTGKPNSEDESATPRLRLRTEGVLAGVVLGLALAQGFVRFSTSETEVSQQPVRRFDLPIGRLVAGSAVISPDGRHIAYVGREAEQSSLRLWSLRTGTARELAGTEGATGPFWAPDSMHIGYTADRSLFRTSIDGETQRMLCKWSGSYRGGTWSPDGQTIVFASANALFQVPANGGECELLIEFNQESGRIYPLDPEFLPTEGGRRAIMFTASDGGGISESDLRVAVLDLESHSVRELAAGSEPAYSPGGYLVFGPPSAEFQGLRALPFSLVDLEATGDPFTVSEAGTSPSVSFDGTLLCETRHGQPHFALTWRDRSGTLITQVGEPETLMSEPALSPDGSRVAVRIAENGNHNVWVYNLEDSTRQQLSFSEAVEGRPAWSPDGTRIAYVREGVDAKAEIVTKQFAGAGVESVLVAAAGAYHSTWSAEGHVAYSAFGESPEGFLDIWFVTGVSQNPSSEPREWRVTNHQETSPEFSPNGRFIAYQSSEASTGPNVFVRPFLNPSDGLWRVSENSGGGARWRRDGRELYYIENWTSLVAVQVSTDGTFAMGRREVLFESEGFRSQVGAPAAPNYDVSADGQRFLVIDRIESERPDPSIRLVENWIAEFQGGK